MNRPKTGVLVLDAMTTKPICVNPKISVSEAAKIMIDNSIGSLIVKEGNRFGGMLTERDYVSLCMLTNKQDLNMLTVGEVMQKDIMTIHPGMDVLDALWLMQEKNSRRLPVIDEGEMVGLITLKDILRLQPQLFELIAERYDLKEAQQEYLTSLNQDF